MGSFLELPRSGKVDRRLLVVVLAGSLLGIGGWLLLSPRVEVASGLTSLGSFAARCAATLAALAASRRASSRCVQRAWLLLTMACLFWVVAEGNAILWWLASGTLAGVPSPIDAMKLLGYLFATVAIILFPATQPERLSRLREIMDFSILISGVMALSWLVFIRPMIVLGAMDPVQIYWRALYAVFDLVFVAFLIRLILVADDDFLLPQLGTLGAAFLGFTISDSVVGFLILQERYRPGSIVDVGWILGSLLIVLASLLVERKVSYSLDWIEARWPIRRRREAMPNIVAGITVGYLILDVWGSGQLDWIGIALAGIMLVLMVARGGIIAGQMDMRLYASLVNHSADLGFICHPDGKFLLVNPALEEAIGGEFEEGRDRRLQAAVRISQPMAEVLRNAGRSGWAGEVQFLRHDGSKFPAVLSLRPVQDERYTRPLLAGTAHDLTEIKDREGELRLTLRRLSEARADLQALNIDLERKVEERTRQLLSTVASLERLNDQLQELDRLKSEFVTLVSHELRAPLTNISTGVEYLLRADGLHDATRDSLALVQQEIDRLAGFVEDILDLSALEAGRFPLDPAELDLVQLVPDVLARFSLTKDRERIVTSISADLPAAFGDRRATTNVIFHLLDNAIKYAPDGEICISAEEDDDHVYLTVTDAGPGIPMEEQEQVFDMFHRLDNQDSRQIYGHGLGLYMARQLMLAQGGEISVGTSPDRGTRFTVGLPRADRLIGREGSGSSER